MEVTGGLNYAGGLCALLHDAAEAYLTDIPHPLKVHLDGYERLEARAQTVILEAFAVEGTVSMVKCAIKRADQELLATEARDLMGVKVACDCAYSSRGFFTTFSDDSYWDLPEPPLREIIHPWSPKKSCRKFLALYDLYRKNE